MSVIIMRPLQLSNMFENEVIVTVGGQHEFLSSKRQLKVLNTVVADASKVCLGS